MKTALMVYAKRVRFALPIVFVLFGLCLNHVISIGGHGTHRVHHCSEELDGSTPRHAALEAAKSVGNFCLKKVYGASTFSLQLGSQASWNFAWASIISCLLGAGSGLPASRAGSLQEVQR